MDPNSLFYMTENQFEAYIAGSLTLISIMHQVSINHSPSRDWNIMADCLVRWKITGPFSFVSVYWYGAWLYTDWHHITEGRYPRALSIVP